MIAGMPPATEAPYSRRLPMRRASSVNSAPRSEMSNLFAVTTDFFELKARRIHSPAGSKPPTSSTTTSTPEERTSSAFSVHRMEAGSSAIFLRAMFRLQMYSSESGPLGLLARILATDRPTVPNPISPTFKRPDAESRFAACDSAGCASDAIFFDTEQSSSVFSQTKSMDFGNWIRRSGLTGSVHSIQISLREQGIVPKGQLIRIRKEVNARFRKLLEKSSSVRMRIRVALGRIVPDGIADSSRGSNHDEVEHQSLHVC